MKTRFYVVMVLTIIALFANAGIRSFSYEGRVDQARLDRYETLTYEQCAERFWEVRQELQIDPKTAKEYFRILGHAYDLIGSARKAMQNPPPTWTDKQRRDFRVDDIVREIPIRIQQQIDTYHEVVAIGISQAPDLQSESERFRVSGHDPTVQPDVFVSGAERIAYWWFWFYVGTMPFIFVHFCIQLRANGNKILHDVMGNPAFPFWLLLWPIGLFRYPMKVSPAEQLRRAKRWAGLVLSTAISCFAGTGKVCEDKRQLAPQHQKYDGLVQRFSFSTFTLSQYDGLDGGIFFPGVVQQSTISVSLPCGMYAGWFDSEPLTDRNLRPNYGREMDYTIGWSHTFGSYTIDASTNYINVIPLSKWFRGDVLQFNERVTKRIPFSKSNAIAPYLWFRQATPVRGSTPVGGKFIHWGATFSHSFNDRVSGSLTVEAVHDTGAFGFRSGYIGRVIEGITWKRSHGVSVVFPQVTYTNPLSHTGDGRRPELTLGIGFNFSPAH